MLAFRQSGQLFSDMGRLTFDLAQLYITEDVLITEAGSIGVMFTYCLFDIFVDGVRETVHYPSFVIRVEVLPCGL